MDEREKPLEEKLQELLKDNLRLELDTEGGMLYAKIYFKDERICACSTNIMNYE